MKEEGEHQDEVAVEDTQSATVENSQKKED